MSSNALVRDLKAGEELAGYRIEAVEREEAGAAVLRAHHPVGDRRAVLLHVAAEPPDAVATVRFLQRAQRLSAVQHPHLLPVYSAQALEGRAVAVTQVPQGTRLDQLLTGGTIRTAAAARIARQVASALEALEDAGAEPPPLTLDRVWMDPAGAHLDALEVGTPALQAPSSAAAVASMVRTMTGREQAPRALDEVLTRALDGAYLSAGQLARALGAVEAQRARLRRAALLVAVVAVVVLAALVAAVA
jgi:hypothetical protein